MHARHRSAITLGIVALALFIVRWPIDNFMCNPATWHSTTRKAKDGTPLAWRQPATENNGEDFFTVVFRGGGGTPAMFAMLGGQRYLVANILWNYSDVLFHQGKPYNMVQPMEATVTLNPSFTEAWSVYGWHLAWNLHTYTDDLTKKKKWLRAGEVVYLRARDANRDKPRPYFDLAWLYINRIGNYEKALPYLQEVVESGEFKPITPEDRKAMDKSDAKRELIQEKKWEPRTFGHLLGFAYKKMGIITGDTNYFRKSIATYRLCAKIDPKDDAATRNADELEKNIANPTWLKTQQESEAKHRERYGMPSLDFGSSSPHEFFYNEDKHVAPAAH